MWVTNPAVGCYYFPPVLQLLPQPLWGLLQILRPPLSIYGTDGRTPDRYIDPAPHTLRAPLIRLLEYNSIAVVMFNSINSLRLKDWYWCSYLHLATKFNSIIRTATFTTLWQFSKFLTSLEEITKNCDVYNSVWCPLNLAWRCKTLWICQEHQPLTFPVLCPQHIY